MGNMCFGVIHFNDGYRSGNTLVLHYLFTVNMPPGEWCGCGKLVVYLGPCPVSYRDTRGKNTPGPFSLEVADLTYVDAVITRSIDLGVHFQYAEVAAGCFVIDIYFTHLRSED